MARAAELEAGSNAFQTTLVERATTVRDLTPDPAPEGKTIESVVVHPYDVFLEEDPLPTFLNWFHVTTREEFLARELLFGEGDVWEQAKVDESARNIRTGSHVSMARIIACQGSAPDTVIALVVTRDLWSLRLNFDFSYVGSRLELLELELVESNLAGRMKSLGPNFRMDLAALSFGQQFRDPRLLGTRASLRESATLIVSRDRGEVEGGTASIGVEQPLYSQDAKWAWGISADYRRDIYRLFSGGDVATVTSATGEKLPYSYGRRRLEVGAKLVRSFGRDVKHDVSLGWIASIRQNQYPAPRITVTEAGAAEFRSKQLPRSEDAGMAAAGYRFYFYQYRQLVDLNAFAITEDFRLGPELVLESRLANPVFGFDSRFHEHIAKLGYTGLAGDDLYSMSLTAGGRVQSGVSDRTELVNRSLSLAAKNFSPRFWMLRLVTGARLVRRSFDLNKSVQTAGGDSTLRGYPSAFFTGSQEWGANIELRSAPVYLLSAYLGGAAFLDLGDAFDTWTEVGMHASAGVGARVLLPQFNRTVIRIDLGFPLESVPDATPTYVVAQFGQAF